MGRACYVRSFPGNPLGNTPNKAIFASTLRSGILWRSIMSRREVFLPVGLPIGWFPAKTHLDDRLIIDEISKLQRIELQNKENWWLEISRWRLSTVNTDWVKDHLLFPRTNKSRFLPISVRHSFKNKLIWFEWAPREKEEEKFLQIFVLKFCIHPFIYPFIHSPYLPTHLVP